MKSRNTNSPSSVLLISTAVLTAALAFGNSAAMAAGAPARHPATVAHSSHPRTAASRNARVAVRRPQFSQPAGLDLGRFIQTVFGGPLPAPYAQIVRNARNVSQKDDEDTYDSSWEAPSYDSPAPVDNGVDPAALAEQAAADSVALSESLQAVEEQNDEAQAAFTQDMLDADQAEINANN